MKVQFRKAASVCRERLNRQSRNVQSVKTAPSSVTSVRSTPTNATPVCSWPEMSSPYQSAPRTSVPVAAQPCSIRLATRAATTTGS